MRLKPDAGLLYVCPKRGKVDFKVVFDYRLPR